MSIINRRMTITKETYEMIKNMLELNPCLVFNFLNIFGEFEFDGFENEFTYKDMYIPEINNVNVILGTKNKEVISKYMLGKSFTLTETKMIADSFVRGLETIIEAKKSYQSSHPDEYAFVKNIHCMSKEELKEAFSYLSDEDKKVFLDKVVSLTLLSSKEDTLKIISDIDTYKMFADVAELPRITHILPDKEFEQALLKSENAFLIELILEGTGVSEENQLEFEELENPREPKWICASAYSWGEPENGKMSDEYIYESAERYPSMYKFIDEMHAYDRDDIYTTKLVKKYLLKKNQKLKDE